MANIFVFVIRYDGGRTKPTAYNGRRKKRAKFNSILKLYKFYLTSALNKNEYENIQQNEFGIQIQ